MQAGRLRHRVIVEDLTVTLDSDGAQVESWLPAFPRALSAEIRALSGHELLAAAAVQSKVTTRIKLRYRPGFLPSMRVVHRDVIYNIEAIVPDPDSGFRYVTLHCSTGVQHRGQALA